MLIFTNRNSDINLFNMSKVEILTQLGFDKQRAAEALQRTQGQVDTAISLLCDESKYFPLLLIGRIHFQLSVTSLDAREFPSDSGTPATVPCSDP